MGEDEVRILMFMFIQEQFLFLENILYCFLEKMDSESVLINDEFLLQCISNYKPLYDKTDKCYKSLIQKENCWTSVARSLGCTGNIIDLWVLLLLFYLPV